MILNILTPKHVQQFSIAEQASIKLRLLPNSYLPIFFTGFNSTKFGTAKFGTAKDRVDTQYIQNIVPVGTPPKISTYLQVDSAQTFGAP